MAWSDIVQGVKDVLLDIQEKQAMEEQRAKRIASQESRAASAEQRGRQLEAAGRGTYFAPSDVSNDMLEIYERPISFEDFVQTNPYRPLFEQYVQEYENEADPVMRMLIADKYLRSPLGGLSFPSELINEMRKTDEIYAYDPSIPRRHKENIRNTRGIFDQQMTKFIRNV